MDLRVTTYATADPAPWFVWNRYPSGIIGAAVRVGQRRLLSVVWAKPNLAKGDWGRHRA